jgi:hypothetical protein
LAISKHSAVLHRNPATRTSSASVAPGGPPQVKNATPAGSVTSRRISSHPPPTPAGASTGTTTQSDTRGPSAEPVPVAGAEVEGGAKAVPAADGPPAELSEQIGRLKMELEWVKRKAAAFL